MPKNASTKKLFRVNRERSIKRKKLVPITSFSLRTVSHSYFGNECRLMDKLYGTNLPAQDYRHINEKLTPRKYGDLSTKNMNSQ